MPKLLHARPLNDPAEEKEKKIHKNSPEEVATLVVSG